MYRINSVTEGSELSEAFGASLFSKALLVKIAKHPTIDTELATNLNRRISERKEVYAKRAVAQELCKVFNLRYPVGTEVHYRITGNAQSAMKLTVRWPAEVEDISGNAVAHFFEFKGSLPINREHVTY
jgi:hypothetical protein